MIGALVFCLGHLIGYSCGKMHSDWLNLTWMYIIGFKSAERADIPRITRGLFENLSNEITPRYAKQVGCGSPEIVSKILLPARHV
mmetsp:Transcript_9393/g.16953  ORF Transcript_9393/g.16953 Transcript_9393/m.16953 type:complete len:85 (-) Transcript_9393:140-394(-)